MCRCSWESCQSGCYGFVYEYVCVHNFTLVALLVTAFHCTGQPATHPPLPRVITHSTMHLSSSLLNHSSMHLWLSMPTLNIRMTRRKHYHYPKSSFTPLRMRKWRLWRSRMNPPKVSRRWANTAHLSVSKHSLWLFPCTCLAIKHWECIIWCPMFKMSCDVIVSNMYPHLGTFAKGKLGSFICVSVCKDRSVAYRLFF